MSMLDAVFHAPILADLPNVCMTAGLQPKYLHSSMTEVCGEIEIDWVRCFHEYRAEGVGGLLLDGVKHPDSRCQAICAALIRNFVDARTIPVNTVLELHEAGEMVSPTVLIIPNFYVHTLGKAFQGYKIQALYDLLLSRAVQSKPTVLYVEKMEGMVAAYGAPFADFLSQFKIAK